MKFMKFDSISTNIDYYIGQGVMEVILPDVVQAPDCGF